ncbi:hypothetical protein BBJ28_00015970 [Nothophytophthora sp. Chile5]|nr:hypothetical protein BBJ28_00015970 [Nothophytophthora sp. Chile5]
MRRSLKPRAAAVVRRRSPRLAARASTASAAPSAPPPTPAAAAPSAPRFKHGTLSRAFETQRATAGDYAVVIGVDEAGRGPLAGPVVAAACHVPSDVALVGVQDSKKLSEPQREALFEQLTSDARVAFAVHVSSAQRIDEINILQATLEAMTEAAEAVAARLKQPKNRTLVLVDGNCLPPALSLPAETVVKGDAKVFSIAAASIIAKVTRDRLMREFDAQFPQYGLAQHKGYPTKAHVAAIAQHGPCAIHRLTFAPLKPKDKSKSRSKPKGKATKKPEV